jgi:hypothetical protein
MIKFARENPFKFAATVVAGFSAVCLAIVTISKYIQLPEAVAGNAQKIESIETYISKVDGYVEAQQQFNQQLIREYPKPNPTSPHFQKMQRFYGKDKDGDLMYCDGYTERECWKGGEWFYEQY